MLNIELPRYAHDCAKCIFVGHFDSHLGKFDGYVCPEDKCVVARHSDAGQDCISMATELVEASKHRLLKPIADRYSLFVSVGRFDSDSATSQGGE